jgi:EmrB/QacA subfamily drug resistance transporter
MSQQRAIRPALVLALVCLPIFIGALDLTVVSAVLPQVMYDLELPLQTRLDEASWMVSGYLLAYTVTMAFMGRIGDLYGRRRVYLLCLTLFAAGSGVVALAVTLPGLIAGRVIQALGGGAMVPVSMALVGDLYPPGRRAGPLGLIGAVDTAGWVVGHLYGGIMVRFLDWRWIFWLNIPLALGALGLTWWAMRGLAQERRATGMDWLGVALMALGLTALNIGLSAGGELTLAPVGLDEGASLPPYSLPLVVAAAALLALFAWRQRRAEHPLVDPDLVRRPAVVPAGGLNFILGYCIVVALVNVPLFVNTLVATSLEEGAWMSGWLLSAFTLPMALAAVPGGWLSNRLGTRGPIWLGTAIGATGFFLLGTWTLETGYREMVPALVVAGVGLGLVIAPVSAAVINAAGATERGVAAALVIVLRLVGMTVGVSAMTTYGLRRFQVISAQLLAAGGDEMTLAQAAQVAAKATVRVVDEAFWWAAAGCVVGLVLAFWAKEREPQRLQARQGS